MEYTVKRTKRKTLSIQVTRQAQVVVHSPLRLSAEAIKTFVDKNALWIAQNLARAQAAAEKDAAITPEKEALLRARAAELLPLRVDHFAAIMGVCPSGVRITSAKSRFGSCSPENRLCFSWRLMLYPEPAIDYVVVHELAHIRQKNHSPAFYREIAAVMPDYLQRKALLRME